jgi:hypothetical protein
MAGWFLCVYELNVLAAGGLDPSSPKGKLDIVRYWIQYVPPMALAAGGVVALAGAWLIRRLRLPDRPRLLRSLPAVVLAGLVCAGPAAFAAQYATNHVAFAPNGGDALEDLRDHLRGQDFAPERVWTDWETKRILPAYQRDFFGGEKVWSGKPMSITGKGEPQPGDYVLLFSAKSSTCSHCRTALKPWMKKHPDGPPANWRVEYTSETGNLVLYRVT